MRKLIIVLCCTVLAAALSGCHFGKGIKGSGNRKAEKRELQPFKAIDTTGAYEVEVSCQKPTSFEIEADDNILPLIDRVRDGVLITMSSVTTLKGVDFHHPARSHFLCIAEPAT